jgi:phosphate transport system permease protein
MEVIPESPTVPVPSAPSVPPGGAARSAVLASVRRRTLFDRLMRWVVVAGGLGIIVSVLGILFFIVAAVVPLFRAASVETETVRKLSAAVATGIGTSRALVGDEYETLAVVLGLDGVARTFSLEAANLAEIATRPLVAGDERVLDAATDPEGKALSAVTSRGRALLQPVRFDTTYEGDRRVVTAVLADPVEMPLVESTDAVTESGFPSGRHAATLDDDGNVTFAAQRADGRVVIARREASTNAITGETTSTFGLSATEAAPALSAMVIDGDQRNLYAGGADGSLLWWPLESGVPGPAQVVRCASPVTALTLLIGGRSLIAGHQDGTLSVWFPVRAADESFHLTRIRSFPPHDGAIASLTPSARNKAFLASDRAGGLGLYYSTSERVLWRGRAPVGGQSSEGAGGALAFSPKGDGAAMLGGGELARLAVDNPHPEVSIRALFGRIWYEGYEKPEYVWQSTGGTDDFEPKLGLTPLVLGTVKGTIYSLLIAIPLGVFGAMFASQFLHPRLLRVVKPTVEVMAALPSVVLGFLAGLWLAPRVEKGFPALILAVVLIPAFVLLTGAAWRALPRGFRGRFPDGAELVPFGLATLAAAGLAIAWARPFADVAFGGNFQTWLLETTGLPYDQRNAVVVGLAMGLAVIPIIFAISEDAFSNVPKALTAGSLAMGANRWQTVTRVVLPTASPGIFSAIMIGFGRAVGETMIVLMATGNTPILDFNAFNGFRTLSANIAVEIPEAPLGGTLYRVLFLAALLLFAMTFAVNTAAELVRQRLRQKYSQL